MNYKDSPITYVYGGNLEECHKVIADLEAKLAEKDKTIDALQEINKSLGQTCNNDLKEIERLKEELAEKECELKQLNTRILVSQLQAPEEQRLKIIGSSCCQYNPNQDKISFCIEKLEKVKEEIDKRPVSIRNYDNGEFDEIILDDVYDVINNQITELKGEGGK